VILLPPALQRLVTRTIADFFNTPPGRQIDFAEPAGEQALVAPDSVSWQIYKNPITLYIGGTAAVILELAEPRVSDALWKHSSFRRDPAGRLRRTALAAMITVYGARSVALPMIAAVTRMHAAVEGRTDAGLRYSANDPQLLAWVQATAAFGFAESYSRYVQALDRTSVDTLYHEGVAASRLYGAHSAPVSVAHMQSLFDSMCGALHPSPIIVEFLHIMRSLPIFPLGARWLQGMLLRAAVEIIPSAIRERLELGAAYGLRPREHRLVRMAARLSDRIVLSGAPAAQSCVRLGLPVSYLYRERHAPAPAGAPAPSAEPEGT